MNLKLKAMHLFMDGATDREVLEFLFAHLDECILIKKPKLKSIRNFFGNGSKEELSPKQIIKKLNRGK